MFRSKPDFICIGPEKTGTTWLYEKLKQNSEIFLPPKKEIRYLNEGNWIPKENYFSKWYSNHWHYKNIRRYFKKKIRYYIDNKQYYNTEKYREELLWDLRYIFGIRSYYWYGNLFSKRNKVSGDITPTYYFLEEKDIKRIQKKFPDLKIIIILRDPIYRTWSKAKMNLCSKKGKKIEEVSKDDFFDFFRRIKVRTKPYHKAINVWKYYFDNVFIGYYDLLSANPQEFFNKICIFLDVEVDANQQENLYSKVNVGLKRKLPEDYYKFLKELYFYEILDYKNCLLNEYTNSWYRLHYQ